MPENNSLKSLLTTGPDSSEVFPADFAVKENETGSWINKNEQAIYGTKGGVYTPGKNYVSSFNGNKFYIHLINSSQSELTLPCRLFKNSKCCYLIL